MSSSPSSSSSSNGAFGPVHDVPCTVEVVLGSRTIRVRDCLDMKAGSIIGIDQAAGADVTLTINGVPVALGEVLVVDDHTSVRVTEILSAPEGELL